MEWRVCRHEVMLVVPTLWSTNGDNGPRTVVPTSLFQSFEWMKLPWLADGLEHWWIMHSER